MKRVLCVVLGERGHVHPLLGPAQKLSGQGVAVSFFAPTDISASLTRAGLPSFVGRYGVTGPDENRGKAFADLVADPGRLHGWIRTMLIGTVPGFVDALDEVVARLSPDALVIDPMAYGAVIVAERRGIPWGGLSTSLNPVVLDRDATVLQRTIAELSDERNALFARFGVSGKFRVCDCISPRLTACFTTRELVGNPPEDVDLVGPSLPRRPRGDEPPFDFGRLPANRKVVFMALGSQIWHQPKVFGNVIEAIRDLDVTLVAAAGTLDLGPLPENVIAVPYAPQLDILERAAAFITHGGANSVMEALAQGAPMLVSPICNDQHHNADILERRGVALQLDLASCAPRRTREAIAELIQPGPIRNAVNRVAASYRQNDGASAAAALVIERLLGGSVT